jgi:hypothetical protein
VEIISVNTNLEKRLIIVRKIVVYVEMATAIILKVVRHALMIVDLVPLRIPTVEMERVIQMRIVWYVLKTVALVLRPLTQYVAMECVIQMKIVTHVLQIVLDHVSVLMEKCAMIQMYVYHILYTVNQNFLAPIGMEQHVNARHNMVIVEMENANTINTAAMVNVTMGKRLKHVRKSVRNVVVMVYVVLWKHVTIVMMIVVGVSQ